MNEVNNMNSFTDMGVVNTAETIDDAIEKALTFLSTCVDDVGGRLETEDGLSCTEANAVLLSIMTTFAAGIAIHLGMAPEGFERVANTSYQRTLEAKG